MDLDDAGRLESVALRFRGWSPRSGFWFDDPSLYRQSRNGWAIWQVRPRTGPPEVPERVTQLFVGRREELGRLEELLLPESADARPVAVCAVEGMPGVGKSYLADRFAHENAGRFPGGYVRLVVDPQAPAAVQSLRQELADRLELRAGEAELEATLRERLLQPRTLVHVENVDSPAAEREVIRLLRGLRGCALVITGRLQDLGWEEGWRPLRIAPFPEETALEQLWTELEREPATPQEGQEHRNLVAALGALPLAIHLAAGYLRHGGTAAGLLGKLHVKGLRVEPFHRAGVVAEGSQEARTILTASVEISLEILTAELGEAASHLLAGLRALGHAPLTGFGRSLGAALAGLGEDEMEELVVHAQRLSLLLPVSRNERPDGAWRIHPMIAELLREGSDRAEAHRMTEWFVARLPRLPHGQETEQGRAWGEVNAEHLALAAWLPLVPPAERARVRTAGREYAWMNGPFRAWAELCEAALRQGPSDDERSAFLWTLGWVSRQAGAMDRAFAAAQEKADVDRRREDEREVAQARNLAANILQTRGQLDEALRIWQEEVLPILEKLGHVRNRAVTLGQIADILQSRGQLDEALKIRQEEELPVFERLGDVRERAVTLGKIADILKSRGQLDEALKIRQEEQLPVYERLGDVRERAVTLGKIADILQSRGQFDEALKIRQEEVLPVFERLGDVRSRAAALGRIAEILQTQGQLNEALQIRREEELSVYERLGDVRSRLVTWANIASIYLDRGEEGDHERAAELLVRALQDAERLRIPEADQIRRIQARYGLSGA